MTKKHEIKVRTWDAEGMFIGEFVFPPAVKNGTVRDGMAWLEAQGFIPFDMTGKQHKIHRVYERWCEDGIQGNVHQMAYIL